MKSQLIILDYGSQVTQLIARTVRELGVYCEIVPGNCSFDKIKNIDPKAIILSGGPSSVRFEDAPRAPKELWDMGIPIFAICYGMQHVADELGGKVEGWARAGDGVLGVDSDETSVREFGPAELEILEHEDIYSGFSPGEKVTVWMSHGDKVTELPPGFVTNARSKGSPIASFANPSRKIYGVQYHPEVHHTPKGSEIFRSFLFDIAKLDKDWDMKSFISETIDRIREEVPTGNVVCGLSGGVDSAVAAMIVSKAIGDRLHCIFVDNGLLRSGEAEQVMIDMKALGLNVHLASSAKLFLGELAGITDPETKRKTIGRVFIDVFEDESKDIPNVGHLVQGTLYPDVIESVSVIGNSVTIKSHHNVGGLKENMQFALIEPLRELFKDEVRALGRELGMPEHVIDRQPFPGPGLAIRCLGEVTDERLKKLRIADKIVTEEVIGAGLNKTVWQAFAVLLPVQSVGVMGDGRTYEECIALRVVTSRDGMTADWYLLPEDLLRKISSRIVNETSGVNRVVLDITTKPPSTIEWE